METIQVSIAHAYPGTEFYDYVEENNLITIDSMTDDGGHQLAHIKYPGLTAARRDGDGAAVLRRVLLPARGRPGASCARARSSTPPRAKRLYKEAREYLALRSKRKKFIRDQKSGAARATEERAG